MKAIFTTLLILTITGSSVNAHPVHVSLCNIEVKEDELTIVIKMFKDDFQLAIEHNFGQFLDFENENLPESKKVIDEYINNALEIVLNKKDSLKLEYRDLQIGEDALWFYYSFDAPVLKRIDIKNHLLLDIYFDQTNLMIVNHKGKQNGYRFNLKNTEERIVL